MSLVIDGQKCAQPGCGGMLEGGFCNACGLEPAGAAPLGGSPFGNHRTGTIGTFASAAGSVVSLSRTGRSARTASSRRGSARTRGSSRRQLGLGIVQLPPLQTIDPVSVIMAEPVVPENKRYCAHCNDRLKREKGFCPKCGKPYCFVPTLKAGDVVADQYEVLGCLAFGGLGWIYLAKDKALSRWVVLKGLLNAQDEAGAAAAVAERQFLAAVKHPNIVGVYNFVQRGSEGYIVMEYVGGKTLKTLRKERGPLPAPEAIAYIHRILGAFAYLHRQDPPLVYCDFKPDNFMLEGEDVKLIDMGGVRRADDPGGDVYGTKGYSAPEAGDSPSPVSDLYTVARTLAVLICEFRGFQSAYEFTLPTPGEQPVLAKHESLYRFLLKATRTNPDDRFQSADEMAEQLAGVLREVVSVEKNEAHPAESAHFGGEALRQAETLEPDRAPNLPALIPSLKVDASDPAAQWLLTNIGGGGDLDRQLSLYGHAVGQFPHSVEAKLRLARTLMDMGNFTEAEARLGEAEEADPFDWRVVWLRGIAHFLQGGVREAAAHFEHVVAELPGELAPKLALALAAEAAGEADCAIRLYDVVSTVDPGFTSATFGLARCLRAASRGSEAAAAYGRVPASSSAYTRAQIARIRTCIQATPTAGPSATDLQDAAETVEALTLDAAERCRLSAEIQYSALGLLRGGRLAQASTVRLFGQSLQESALRKGVESSLRTMARYAADAEEKVRLVDLANHVRPRTLL